MISTGLPYGTPPRSDTSSATVIPLAPAARIATPVTSSSASASTPPWTRPGEPECAAVKVQRARTGTTAGGLPGGGSVGRSSHSMGQRLRVQPSGCRLHQALDSSVGMAYEIERVGALLAFENDGELVKLLDRGCLGLLINGRQDDRLDKPTGGGNQIGCGVRHCCRRQQPVTQLFGKPTGRDGDAAHPAIKARPRVQLRAGRAIVLGMNDPGDEFAALPEVAAELGLPAAPLPRVCRTTVEVGEGQDISALVWGDGPAELALLHGGGQNAHTWDLVAMLLGRPLVALDLPGHGHSSWRADRDYSPRRSADAVAAALDALAPHACGVVGMSLGGLTTLALAATRPDLLRRVVLVDVTPGAIAAWGSMTDVQRGTVALLAGPHAYPTRKEMIERAVAASPRRPASAVRRGVVHNTVRQPDGTWAWRYDARDPARHHQEPLWDAVPSLTMPTLLVRGGESHFTTDADVQRNAGAGAGPPRPDGCRSRSLGAERSTAGAGEAHRRLRPRLIAKDKQLCVTRPAACVWATTSNLTYSLNITLLVAGATILGPLATPDRLSSASVRRRCRARGSSGCRSARAAGAPRR